jgi:hypothetical protein
MREEYPQLRLHAARFNLQVRETSEVVAELRHLSKEIRSESAKVRAYYESSRSLVDAFEQQLHRVHASQAELRSQTHDVRETIRIATDRIDTLAANLPDRERIAEAAGRTAANDVYMQLQYEVFGWFERVEVTPELGAAILTVRDAVLHALEQEKRMGSATRWQKFRMRLMDVRGPYQRWQRALTFPVTLSLLVIFVFQILFEYRR